MFLLASMALGIAGAGSGAGRRRQGRACCLRADLPLVAGPADLPLHATAGDARLARGGLGLCAERFARGKGRMMATLYHAPNARSLRVLWTLEELGAKADVKTLPFPPREKQPDYLKVNPTGAIPAMVDGDRMMTESLAICEYLPPSMARRFWWRGRARRVPFLEWLWYAISLMHALEAGRALVP